MVQERGVALGKNEKKINPNFFHSKFMGNNFSEKKLPYKYVTLILIVNLNTNGQYKYVYHKRQ